LAVLAWQYVSPEMLEHDGHNKATDYWTLGIFIYECLCGTTPFAASNYLNTYDKILSYAKRGKLKWPAPVSREVQDLIQGLMAPRPEDRLGCQPKGCKDIKSHPWFTGFVAPWVPEIKNDTDTTHFDPEDASEDSDTEEYTDDSGWCAKF
jgi:serine/threonine protein kinase